MTSIKRQHGFPFDHIEIRIRELHRFLWRNYCKNAEKRTTKYVKQAYTNMVSTKEGDGVDSE